MFVLPADVSVPAAIYGLHPICPRAQSAAPVTEVAPRASPVGRYDRLSPSRYELCYRISCGRILGRRVPASRRNNQSVPNASAAAADGGAARAAGRRPSARRRPATDTLPRRPRPRPRPPAGRGEAVTERRHLHSVYVPPSPRPALSRSVPLCRPLTRRTAGAGSELETLPSPLARLGTGHNSARASFAPPPEGCGASPRGTGRAHGRDTCAASDTVRSPAG